MSVVVTLEDGLTGEVQRVELPTNNFVAVACTWTAAREVIAAKLASMNGTMRPWRAEELAEQAVEALAGHPGLLLALPSAEKITHGCVMAYVHKAADGTETVFRPDEITVVRAVL